jgi:hypothetical protein
MLKICSYGGRVRGCRLTARVYNWSEEAIVQKIRVLVFGTDEFPVRFERLERAGLQVEVTFEPQSAYMGRDGHQTTRRSRQLAHQAAEFDAVLVMNNSGTGLDRVKALPAGMLNRTMVMWKRGGQIEEVMKAPYRQAGVSHFGEYLDGDEALAFLVGRAMNRI